MRKLAAAAALVVAPSLAATALAAPRLNDPGVDSAAAVVVPAKAGARPAALTVSIRTELQCGKLRTRSVQIALPSQLRVPRTIAATNVLVSGQPAGVAQLTGHMLTVTPPVPTGVTCNSITVGVAKIVVKAAANLGNPKKAGSYKLSVSFGGQQLPAVLKIR